MTALAAARRWISPAMEFPPFRSRIEGKTRNGKVIAGTAQFVKAFDSTIEFQLRYSDATQHVRHAWCTHWRQP